ncbi:hypothetical protein QWY79_10320 [Halomonas sabkhae]|uniref:hypothetical protein n=1 Tax=Halomonas sabkhae TaxID=626223 RepID=UPI0025B3CEF5|nr:hypothetical protein [Halomonas sabkhae]MDN3525658.1 hypothetical protein [Halomonas sabkhae]
MNIIQRVYDRMTGVLGRDCQGRAVKKGDLVEPAPHIPSEKLDPRTRCQMIADRHPKESEFMGLGALAVLVCIAPDGNPLLVRQWSAIRKVPQCEQEARWENVERMTGWVPRTVEQPSEVPA